MRSNDEIIDIINSLREQQNLSISELARRVGMAKSALSRYFNKTREFPLNRVEEFANALNTSSEYILGFEEDNKLIDNTVSVLKQLKPPRQEKVYTYAKEQLHEQESTIEENKICYLPTIENSPAAANPTELAYGDVSIEDQAFVDVPAGADFAVPIHGNSMEPVIHDGDYVFVKTQSHIENGEIALVEIDGDGVTCKKIFFNPEDGSIILHSLNAEYDDREIEPDRVRVIGKVLL